MHSNTGPTRRRPRSGARTIAVVAAVALGRPTGGGERHGGAPASGDGFCSTVALKGSRGGDVVDAELPAMCESALDGVYRHPPRPGRSHRWNVRAAALVFGAAVLAACNPNNGATTASTRPSVEVSATGSPSPALVDHRFHLPPFPTIRAAAPLSWDDFHGWGLVRDACGDQTGRCESTDRTMGIMFWGVTRVDGHPCEWFGSSFDPGPSVEDLASALRSVPTRSASEPESVTVGGVDGLYMQWSVPDDVDFDDCDLGSFESWSGNITGTNRYQQAPGQVDRLWILDVGGERLVIDAFYLPGTPEEDRREIDDIIASIRFSTP